MVNSKNVAFKVDKQAPTRGPPPKPYGTVINCRKPVGRAAVLLKNAPSAEVKSQRVPLSKIPGAPPRERKRKRSHDDAEDDEASLKSKKSLPHRETSPTLQVIPMLRDEKDRNLPRIKPLVTKPARLRKGKCFPKEIDLDCWFTILSFSDPAQLLEMRDKIVSCFRFLRDNPSLWKHSRSYYYGDGLPDPPSSLTEFQYAHLRHGSGCMGADCGAQFTRKTYWAFLRRWCKKCLHSKIIKEADALAMLKDANGEDISFIRKCLPDGVVDSWGNFVGVGPPRAHTLKTVYLRSDVESLVEEYNRESRENLVSWHAEMRTWMNNKSKMVEERRAFARDMERWEDKALNSKKYDYQGKKEARKTYFVSKAAKLNPPIAPQELEKCPAFKRAIAIPKEPNLTSWLQLKPKLEKEAAELAAGVTFPDSLRSTPGTMTPSKPTTPSKSMTPATDSS